MVSIWVIAFPQPKPKNGNTIVCCLAARVLGEIIRRAQTLSAAICQTLFFARARLGCNQHLLVLARARRGKSSPIIITANASWFLPKPQRMRTRFLKRLCWRKPNKKRRICVMCSHILKTHILIWLCAVCTIFKHICGVSELKVTSFWVH